MAAHDRDTQDDSQEYADIIVETVGPSDDSSNTKEKYEVQPPQEVDEKAGTYAADEDAFPMAAICNTFSTFGYVNSWGIFQNYYQETVLRTRRLQALGRFFDLGYFRSIFLTSSAVLVVHQYWHFLLCQAFWWGIFGPTTAVIAHWFKKRRGLAMGIVAMGSSLGGTILPIAGKNLIPLVGFQWTMRIFGFILFTTLGLSNLLLKRRLPPRRVAGGLLNLRAFKSAAYSVYCASSFVIFLGIYTVLTYIGVSATDLGYHPNFHFTSSLFGRYAAGHVSDKVGAMNVMIPFTAWTGILTYAWPFAQSKSSLIAITVIYGFGSGAYVSLLSNPIMEMGMFMSILAIGALAGPPISGAINTATGNFKAVGYYAGTAVLVGVGLICVSRHLILRRVFGKA
ncbi:major facilitator superfamily domain-containing protein [Flammula alnicola]|nr:major facilitator superfamily domain-containing protein [Flammula alnicola]